jgi:hypothetical protein
MDSYARCGVWFQSDAAPSPWFAAAGSALDVSSLMRAHGCESTSEPDRGRLKQPARPCLLGPLPALYGLPALWWCADNLIMADRASKDRQPYRFPKACFPYFTSKSSKASRMRSCTVRS